MPHLRLLTATLCVAIGALAAPAVTAQGNMFAPAVHVNDRVITQFEVDQRARFYEVLRAPGDPAELAMEALINERLQLDAASRAGVTADEAAIEAGIAEFAGRANLEPDRFLAELGKAGIAPETVTDFITAGVLWRGVVRDKFGPRAQVSEAEIDRAIEIAARSGEGASGVRVLLSEIFLPTNSPEAAAAAQARAAEIARIDTPEAFAAAARRYSAAPSRDRGGRQDWLALGKLPPAIRSQILGSAPGSVIGPVEVPNAIAFFQLRAIEETGTPSEEVAAIEFARFFIPGGRTREALAEAARIEARVDTCDDLYGIAKGLPPERLMRDTQPTDQIAGDIALELARLDAGEVSTNLTTGDGQALVFLMMCGRTMALAEELDREEIRKRLVNQRLGSYASGYLSELRADAFIVYP